MKLSKKLLSLPIALFALTAQDIYAADEGVVKKPQASANKKALVIDGKVSLSPEDIFGLIEAAPKQIQNMPLASLYNVLLFNKAVQSATNIAAKKQGLHNSVEYKKAMAEAEATILTNMYLFGDMRSAGGSFTEAEMQGAYDKYKKSFVSEKYVAVKHFVDTDEKKAKEFLAKLAGVSKSDLEDKFVKLAKESSMLSNQVDLKVTDSFPVAALKKVALDLAAGSLSEVIKNDQYYHVIYRPSKNDTGETKVATFAELKEKKGLLEALAMEERVNSKINDAFKGAKVELYDINGKKVSREELQAEVQKNMPALTGLKR